MLSRNDIVKVTPADDDDPVAVRWKGEHFRVKTLLDGERVRCESISPKIVTLVFRVKDLERIEGAEK